MGKITAFIKKIKSGYSQGKGVYDFFNDFVKNKHHVRRRLNLIFLFLSMAFALFAAINFIFGGTLRKVPFAWSIAVYCIFGLYALTVIAIIVAESVYRRNVTVKTTESYNKALRIFQRVVKAISLAMSAVSFSLTIIVNGLSGRELAMNIILQVFSVILFVFSMSSGISKLIVKFVMWLKSPVNKRQFRFVATEWYEKAAANDREDKEVKSIQKIKTPMEYIQNAIDECLLPHIGKKYIDKIEEAEILAAVKEAPEEDKYYVEGTVKRIFEYAAECGLIEQSPCENLVFEGDLSKQLKDSQGSPSSSAAGGFLKKFFKKKQSSNDI